MRNHLLKFLFFTAIMVAREQITAQTETDTISPVTAATPDHYLLAAFEIASPDTTFVPMQNAYGWEEPATQSLVVCVPAPGSFREMAEQQLEKEQTFDGNVKIISKEIKDLNGRSGVLVTGEITENPENPFYSVMYFTPLDDNMVLMVNALYPKSQHERLSPKMLTSFGSARLKQ